MRRAGRVAYGVGAAGMGVLILLSGKLASVFQSVPPWVPLRQWLAYISGAALVASGLVLSASKPTRLAALVLTVNFSVWLLLFNLPTLLAHPKVVGAWEGCGLNMTVVAGGLILLSRVNLARRLYASRARPIRTLPIRIRARLLRAGRLRSQAGRRLYRFRKMPPSRYRTS